MEKIKHFAVAKVKGQIFRYSAPSPFPYLQLSSLNAQCWVSIGYRRRSMSHWATIVILTKQITYILYQVNFFLRVLQQNIILEKIKKELVGRGYKQFSCAPTDYIESAQKPTFHLISWTFVWWKTCFFNLDFSLPTPRLGSIDMIKPWLRSSCCHFSIALCNLVSRKVVFLRKILYSPRVNKERNKMLVNFQENLTQLWG